MLYTQKHSQTLVITALNDTLYNEYGHKFVDTFPGTLDLQIWSETHLPIPHRSLPYRDFYLKHRTRHVTSYKYDAVRFHWKPQAVYYTLQQDYIKDYDSLLWIDADTIFLKEINDTWIKDHLHTEGIMSYMGRYNYYSECGLLYFNLRNTHTEQYVKDVWQYYTTDEVYNLQEQHDSYIWDYVRGKHELEYNHTFRNLGVDYKVPGGHIQAHLYGEWFDHCKGKRKTVGKSAENNARNRVKRPQ